MPEQPSLTPDDSLMSLAAALLVRFKGGLIRLGLVALALFSLGWIVRQDLLFLVKLPLLKAFPAQDTAHTALYQVTDAFFLHVKLAAFIALLLFIPYLLWELWRLLRGRIPERYRKHGLIYLCTCGGLFGSGVLFGYFILLPVVLTFLVAYAGGEIPLLASNAEVELGGTGADGLAFALADYVSFTLRFLFGIGFAFLTPMLLFSLAGLGLVNPATLAGHRRIAFVFLVVCSALLTPPDPVSMVLLALPLYLLYELGLQAGKLVWPGE